jgi:type VI secretion system protein VasI
VKISMAILMVGAAILGALGSCSPVSNGWKRLGGQRIQFVLVAKDRESDRAVYDAATAALCDRREICIMHFWSDSESVPKVFPVSDDVFDTQTAVYSHNPNTSHTEFLWACRINPDPDQCFGNETTAAKAGAATPQKVSTGLWRVSESKSAMDDSPLILLMLDSENTVEAGFDSRQVRPSLTIRCRENKTDVLIDWDQFLDTEIAYVRYRMGSAGAQEELWGVSTDNREAAFADRPIPFIRSLLTADRLLVETLPHLRNLAQAQFDIRGLSNVIERVQKACNWR